jgi:predicted small lipoprotein YifL
MKRLIFALAAISFVLPFAGCGQSGPLYLPGNPSKLETLPPKPTNEEEEETEESEGG